MLGFSSDLSLSPLSAVLDLAVVFSSSFVAVFLCFLPLSSVSSFVSEFCSLWPSWRLPGVSAARGHVIAWVLLIRSCGFN